MLTFVGHHLNQQQDNILELNITDLSLGLYFWCIGYPLIQKIIIFPSRKTSDSFLLRHDQKYTDMQELEIKYLEINSIAQKRV